MVPAEWDALDWVTQKAYTDGLVAEGILGDDTQPEEGTAPSPAPTHAGSTGFGVDPWASDAELGMLGLTVS